MYIDFSHIYKLAEENGLENAQFYIVLLCYQDFLLSSDML